MKIIKRPTFPLQECNCCGCAFRVNAKDLISGDFIVERKYVKCPACDNKQPVIFKTPHNETL